MNAKRICLMCIAGIGMIVIASLTTFLISADVFAKQSNGTLLTSSEMAAIFGDVPQLPCVYSGYKCNQGFTDGASNCAFCNSTNARKVCCDLAIADSCNPSGGTACCFNDPRWVGPINNGAGTCTTCGSAQYSRQGDCTDLKHASGADCPS